VSTLLSIALSAAVPLRIAEIQQHGHDAWWATVQAKREEWVAAIAHKGDILMFRGGKKGESAAVFNLTAEALAHLAFCPGGVTFMDQHFEAQFDPPICQGCKKPIEPDVCHCGIARVDHQHEEHQFVPLGCDCLRSKT
jgi:hypothetical protein